MNSATITPAVTIVLPCLNEAETLQVCIEEAVCALKENNLQGEVLVADNGSTDGSLEIAERSGARIVHVVEKGYGNALKGGIKAARGKYILMGDADGSYDFKELPKFVRMLDQGNDLVMGCRLPKGGGKIEKGAMPWKHRWIGNPVLSGLGRLFFSSPVDDFHCGLRGFRKDAIQALDLKTTGMEFASEMVVKASLNNLKIAQVPITLRPDGRSSPPHLRSWRDGWRHLRFMLLYSPKWLFLIPGLVLTLVSTVCFVVLLPGPLKIGGITFDVNTLLVTGIMILVGYQFVALGIFIKSYAYVSGMLPSAGKWIKLVTGRVVEWGIVLGLVFMLAGIVWLTLALFQWKNTGFGPLSYQDSLRMVIPAVICLGLGVQTIFYGFALAVLGIKK